MRIKTFSEELYTKVVTAAENAKIAEDTAYKLLREAYSEKPVRCGFLWLNTRPPTEKEIDKRLAISSYWSTYDYAWDTIDYHRRNMRTFETWLKILNDDASADVILTDDEYTTLLEYI